MWKLFSVKESVVVRFLFCFFSPLEYWNKHRYLHYYSISDSIYYIAPVCTYLFPSPSISYFLYSYSITTKPSKYFVVLRFCFCYNFIFKHLLVLDDLPLLSYTIFSLIPCYCSCFCWSTWYETSLFCNVKTLACIYETSRKNLQNFYEKVINNAVIREMKYSPNIFPHSSCQW